MPPDSRLTARPPMPMGSADGRLGRGVDIGGSSRTSTYTVRPGGGHPPPGGGRLMQVSAHHWLSWMELMGKDLSARLLSTLKLFATAKASAR